MGDRELRVVTAVLIWLWPESWLRTTRGIRRCLVATVVLLSGYLAAYLACLVMLLVSQ
jgi:hypothetical protein